jgi:pantoate--beta-alanine ligase
MQVYDNVKGIRAHLTDLKRKGQTIGLVPTMGALHSGHLSLVRQARECDVVVVSVFVNPLQFNQQEDLDKYPRDLHADLAALGSECDIVFAPTVSEMYPSANKIAVDFGEQASRLEGEFRPGHFNGVGVVVSKLFNILMPDRAYFGLKDLQQYLLIKQMVHDLSFPVEIVGCPIVREESGLAMSSRNQRLSEEGLSIAAHIYQGLCIAKRGLDQNVSIDETKLAVLSYYSSVNGLSIEYLEFVDEQMAVVNHFDKSKTLSVCVAAYVEGVRLIDNLYLRTEK